MIPAFAFPSATRDRRLQHVERWEAATGRVEQIPAQHGVLLVVQNFARGVGHPNHPDADRWAASQVLRSLLRSEGKGPPTPGLLVAWGSTISPDGAVASGALVFGGDADGRPVLVGAVSALGHAGAPRSWAELCSPAGNHHVVAVMTLDPRDLGPIDAELAKAAERFAIRSED